MAKIIPIDEDAVARTVRVTGRNDRCSSGRTARDNDLLTFKVAEPEGLLASCGVGVGLARGRARTRTIWTSLPRETLEFAAALAARYSKAKNAKRVVPCTSPGGKTFTKPRGMPAGKVTLKRFKSVKVEPFPED